MLLVPSNLKKIADVADAGAAGRVASANVRIACDVGVVQATDTKIAVEVRVLKVDPTDFPVQLGVSESPDALVSGKVWKQTFGEAEKLTKRVRDPLMKNVAVRLGVDTVAFAATDGTTTSRLEVAAVDGRYPPLDRIFADIERKPVIARASLNLEQLSRLCDVVASLQAGGASRVDIEIREGHGPVLMTVPSPTEGVESVRALIMPFVD